jgi:hypothetical protein
MLQSTFDAAREAANVAVGSGLPPTMGSHALASSLSITRTMEAWDGALSTHEAVRQLERAMVSPFDEFNNAKLRKTAASLDLAPPQPMPRGATANQSQTLDFERSITAFYTTLLAKQQPLGKEFEKVLHDNLWDLYVRS